MRIYLYYFRMLFKINLKVDSFYLFHKMSHEETRFHRYAMEYDPIRIGSIDGTDTEPHDRAIVRALNSEYTSNKSVRGNPKHTIFIARLNPRTTQDTIRSEFQKFGKIVHCRLVKDIVTGKSKQYAFVEYESTDTVDRTLREMHKEYIDGYEIIVEREVERQLAGWRPRRLGGGFGGRKESGQLRQFRGWCKSFTKTEAFLSVLESILLVVLIVALVFLILHFMACSNWELSNEVTTTSVEYDTKSVTNKEHIETTETTIPSMKCTWKPSEKTEASAHYFYNKQLTLMTSPVKGNMVSGHKSSKEVYISTEATIIYDPSQLSEQLDGEVAEDMYKNITLALVKIRPNHDITYGCILTIISEFWTLTAASCIESIEEVDSLDSYVMIHGYGELRWGSVCAVSDVQIHPQYQGSNRSYDLAALKSDNNLIQRGRTPVHLPTMLDYFLLTIGERFTILGYGKFRTIDDSVSGRGLHRASVHALPRRLCPRGERWAPRHLSAGAQRPRAPCAAAPLCAGALYARGTPCNYCAGAPLLRGALLLGLMADHELCAVACEPALYVNIAAARDWIHTFLYNE